MVDAATMTPAAPPGAPPIGGAAQVLSGMTGRGKELDDAGTALESQLGAIGKGRSDAMAGLEKEAGGLHPPKVDLPPPPVAKSTDPKQVWGSAAMMLAGIGSLFTRTPLTTAMNAAAKVMEGYQTGDAAKADQAFKTWQAASKNAVDLANFQENAYRDALSSIDRRETMTTREAEAAEKDALAQFNAKAAAFKDQTALQVAQEHGIEGVEKLLIQRAKLSADIEKAGPELAESHAFSQALHGLQAEPEFKTADPDKQAEMIHDLRLKVAPGKGSAWTPSQQAHMEQTISQSVANSQIGKDYSAAARNIQAIRVGQLRPGAVAQADLADAYTQMINGGRAIRGFQMKMNTEHASLWDKAEVAEQQLKRGGALSTAQIKDMRDIAEEIFKERTGLYQDAIHQAQARAERQGLNPENVVPNDFNPKANNKPADGPKVGEVEDGYKFKGGDPKDQKNWQKVG